jgi:hypothetical protein
VKKLIIPIKVPEKRSLNIDFPADGVIKKAFAGYEQVSSLLAAGSKPVVKEFISLIVECTPRLDDSGEPLPPELIKRHFYVAESGELVDEENIDYIDTVASAKTGNLIHVFEITPKDK